MRAFVTDRAPSNWPVLSIQSVCDRVTSGGTPSRRVPEYYGGSIPWVKTKELNDDWISATEESITDAALSSSSAKLLPPNTLLMAMYGATVGKLAILERPMTCNQAACAMIVNPSRADFRYLFYQLLNARSQIASLASGAAQQNLSASTIKSLEFPFPSVGEQHEIGKTLSAFDDKIASNNEAIRLMEELGAALLLSRVRTDSAGGLAVSERTLGDFLLVLETGSRPRGGLKDGTVGIVSLGAQHVQSAGVSKHDDFRKVPADFVATMRRGRLEDGDVLVYKDGGKPGNFVPHVSAFGFGFPVDVAVINEHVYRVRATPGISQALLYWILRSRWLDWEMRKRGTGVAIPGLNSSNFRTLPFPALERADVFFLNDALSPLLEKMLRLGAENSRVSELRNALLPELLSGNVRVVSPTGSTAEDVA